jgi:hypothetical protein
MVLYSILRSLDLGRRTWLKLKLSLSLWRGKPRLKNKIKNQCQWWQVTRHCTLTLHLLASGNSNSWRGEAYQWLRFETRLSGYVIENYNVSGYSGFKSESLTYNILYILFTSQPSNKQGVAIIFIIYHST